MTRKSFIKGMLAAGAAPTIVPNSVFGANAPSNRITLGGIGVGGIGTHQLPLCRDVGFEVVSLCDLDWNHCKKVFATFPDARRHRDWREFLSEESGRCDAFYCGAPDHWHALMSLAVLGRKKPLCCVKPLTRRVEECRAVVAAAREAGVATQVTACTSQDEASVRLGELVDAGVFGEIREIHAWSRRPVWPQGMTAYPAFEDPVPQGFDWNLWLGPAKRVAFADRWPKDSPYPDLSLEKWGGVTVYHPHNFRGWFEYGAGALGDMGCHRANTIYRVMGFAYPTHVEAVTSKVSDVAFPLASMVSYDYPATDRNGPVRLVWYDGGLKMPRAREMYGTRMPLEGVVYVGTRGKVLFDAQSPRDCKLVFFDGALERKAATVPRTRPRLPKEVFGPDAHHAIYGEWLNAIRGGAPASCSFEFAQYITEFTHLGNLAIQTRAPVDYDPAVPRVVGNDAANALLRANYENGWSLSDAGGRA